MTAEEWEQVKTVFEAACELPQEDRTVFVNQACGDRRVVREMVLELLANNESSKSAAAAERPISRVPVLPEKELIAGRFRIVRLIAAGGMGEVYEAYDEWLQLRLALKTVRSEHLSDPGSFERFKRELLVARRVSHENLCRVFDFVEHRSRSAESGVDTVNPCFTMELLEGESLSEVLARRRPLPYEEALLFIRQIAKGLQVLHEHGIVHRDLKPSNIMIVPQPGRPARAVVTDFGLAKSDVAEAELFESAPEFQAGAPYFMAPELLKKERPSVASDIYSFGLLVDEMVTHSRAFTSRSLHALYYEKLWEHPRSPSSRSVDLPARWEQTILRCLEADPQTRFAAVSAAVESLEGGAPELPVEPPAAPARDRPKWLSRRAAIGAMIGVPLVGSTAAVTALALQPVNSSIEVFEIENQTNQTDYDYLCKGTTAELMRQLLQLEGVRVYALRTTRSTAPAAAAGRFSLDGMLQVHNGQVRLSMELSDNQNHGSLLWSENYERNGIGDPLALQSEIARSTVAALERRVLLGAANSGTGAYFPSVAYRLRRWFALQTANSLPGPPTNSNAAFHLYMRGNTLLEDLSPATASAAIDFFKRAIEEDPRFALAYSATADAYMALMNYNYAPHPELAQSARYYANHAVEIDATLAEAHSVLAAVRQMDWDWKGAEASYTQALSLKPNLARARRWYAGLILQFGRFDEALREARRALEADPYDRSAEPAVGGYLFLAGRFPEAIDMLLRAIRAKDMPGTHSNLSQVYSWLAHVTAGAASGEYLRLALSESRLIEAAERDASGGERTPYADASFALAFALAGDRANAGAYVEKMEREVEANGTSPVTLAWVYAILDQPGRACDLFDRAAAMRDRKLLYIKVIPYAALLRGNARFQALLKQMSL
jgi:serine/threonine protein kinase/tetratricopeptide (TPR) repeat protein